MNPASELSVLSSALALTASAAAGQLTGTLCIFGYMNNEIVVSYFLHEQKCKFLSLKAHDWANLFVTSIPILLLPESALPGTPFSNNE